MDRSRENSHWATSGLRRSARVWGVGAANWHCKLMKVAILASDKEPRNTGLAAPSWRPSRGV